MKEHNKRYNRKRYRNAIVAFVTVVIMFLGIISISYANVISASYKDDTLSETNSKTIDKPNNDETIDMSNNDGTIDKLQDDDSSKESDDHLEKHSIESNDNLNTDGKSDLALKNESDKKLLMEPPISKSALEPNSEGFYEISSFEDLKPFLDFKEYEHYERCFLKEGKYKFTSDFEINPNDNFFDGKENVIKYGIISAIEDIYIDGKGHTITIKDNDAPALFGLIKAGEFTIENLNLKYPGDVNGFGFAHVLSAKDKQGEYAIANGNVKNINIDIGGNVKPLKQNGSHLTFNNHFTNNSYRGYIATGFTWFSNQSSYENINIKVAGNIGNTEGTRPQNAEDMISSFGFTFFFQSAPYLNQEIINLGYKTWQELFENNNIEILKQAGAIVNTNIDVGGNIQAYGNDLGYSAGLGFNLGEAWVDKINLNIKGDIITDLKGTGAVVNCNKPFTQGFCDQISNLTNSYLSVNNIIFNGENLYNSNSYLVTIGTMADMNGIGNFINAKNNEVHVKGNLRGKTNCNFLTAIGYNNDVRSKNGFGAYEAIENNYYTVGGVDLHSDMFLQFNSLGSHCRAGVSVMTNKVLPEASLKGNKLKVGNIKLTSPKDVGQVKASLLMENASNAKNNTLQFGNVEIISNYAQFYGLGNLENKQPKENYYDNVAENNHLTMENLKIKSTGSKKAAYISFLAGFQDKDQKMKNCSFIAKNIDIDINNAKTNYIGGISLLSQDSIEDCRVCLNNLSINNPEGTTYFGLGASYIVDSSISNSGIFVHGNTDIKTNKLFGGGFVGYSDTANFENNDFQIDGKTNLNTKGGSYGAFAGYLKYSTLKNNSSLVLTDFVPAVGFIKGGNIDGHAHYVYGKAPKYYSGLVAAGNETPVVTNSTLLVDKGFDDTILFRKDSVSESSKDNYLVVVDNDKALNRVAYGTKMANSTEEEMGDVIPVLKKSNNKIGKIGICKRTFQDRFWNSNIAPYEIGAEEKDFAYLTGKESVKDLKAIGIDNDIVSETGENGKLTNYYKRHAGLRGDKGEKPVVYDLLGIKGSGFKLTYDSNGATKGKAPVDNKTYGKNENAVVLGCGDLERKYFDFECWNDKKDGTGKDYKDGNKFEMIKDSTLYAKWTPMTPAIQNISVKKEWKDTEDKDKAEVTANLLRRVANGKWEKVESLKLNAENNWTDTFKDLPVQEKVDSTEKYEYKVVEEGTDKDGNITINGNVFKSEVTGDAKEGFVITNTKHADSKVNYENMAEENADNNPANDNKYDKDTNKKDSVKTGDDTKLIPISLLMTLSLGVLSLLGIRRRRTD